MTTGDEANRRAIEANIDAELSKKIARARKRYADAIYRAEDKLNMDFAMIDQWYQDERRAHGFDDGAIR